MEGNTVTPLRPSSSSASHIDEATVESIAHELAHARAAARRVQHIAQGRELPRHAPELDNLGSTIEALTEVVYRRIFAEAMPELEQLPAQ